MCFNYINLAQITWCEPKKNGFTTKMHIETTAMKKQSQKLHQKPKGCTQQKTASQNMHSLPPQTRVETLLWNI